MVTGLILFYHPPVRSAIIALIVCSGCARLPVTEKAVAIVPEKDRLHVIVDGKPFTDYIFTGYSRPILYPLLGPDQLPMTRRWPMDDGHGEEHDHIHHRSVWYEHGNLNGIDFWSETTNAGKTVHIKFLKIESGQQKGIIQSTNLLVSVSNTPVASDVRTLTFYNTSEGKLFDYEVTTYAAFGDITFGDTKEGTMAIRIAESMRLKRDRKPGAGHIALSTGIKDEKTWGKRADWCDYYGPIDGNVEGVALFDAPSNPRHPTWWHVRDYGLLAANPFGLHEFEKKPAGAGDLKVPAGKSITFKYRIYLHEGDTESARVAEMYREYTDGVAPRFR